MHPPVLILLFGVLLMLGCTRGPTAVLDPVSRDPGQDHCVIAFYYVRQATEARHQAGEMTNQAVVYERLFGRESDWVSGTRLLVQFYEEAAREQDRLSDLHPGLDKCSVCKQATTI